MQPNQSAGQQAFGDIAPKLAQRNGINREQLVELITHLAFYAGWPVAASAIERLREFEE